jgi:hypothetical protein
MEEQEKQQSDDVEEAEATVLPAREAMSLIAPDTSVPFIPDLEPGIEAAPDGTATAQGAASDAQGGTSGEESVSSDDQSTQATNHDSATSQT